MAAGLVSQHQQSSFAAPINGDAGDATVVLGNDNATVTSYDAHDADSTIHVQSSTAATFAATPAGTLGRKWMTNDTGAVYLYYDTGSVWVEANYLRSNTATFTVALISTTALATPSALAATTFEAFASTVSGATIMGYGTTNDVSLKNRAGTTVLGIGPNTTAVNMAGALAITGALSGVTTSAFSGLMSMSPGASTRAVAYNNAAYVSFYDNNGGGVGTEVMREQALASVMGYTLQGAGYSYRFMASDGNPILALNDTSKTAVFAGAVSGITTLAIGGAFTGATSGAFAGKVSLNIGAGAGALGVNNSAIVQVYDNTGGGVGTEVLRLQAVAGDMNFTLQAVTTQRFVFTGAMVTSASTASLSGLNIPHGTAPSSPVNGDVWTTTAGLYVRVNGSTVGPLS